MKADRDDDRVRATLDAIRRDAADPTVNLMPAILDAVRAHVTVGEITAALETVFGTWTERALSHERSSASVCRVLVAKIGFDGHDRGIKVVARTLRDAGMEVIYAGLRQTPETVAAIARDEDVDVVGISMHNGAHLTIAPRVVDALRDAGARAAVVVGGIVPDPDVALLHDAGVAAVLGPGASGDEVVEAVTTGLPRPPPHRTCVKVCVLFADFDARTWRASAGQDSSVAVSVISGTAASARLTGQPALAASACSWNAASSMPGHAPDGDEARSWRSSACRRCCGAGRWRRCAPTPA